MAINRKIFQIWIGTKPLPEREKQWCERMRTLNSTWSYKLHGNELLERYQTDPYVRHLQLQKAPLAFVTDRLRMLLLHDEGGIYLDTDCEPYKPLDTLKFWDEPSVEFVYGMRDPYRPGIALQRGLALVDNSVLASAPGSTMCKKLLTLWRPEEVQITGHRLGLGILTHADWTCRGLNYRYFYAMQQLPDSILGHDFHNAGSWVENKTPLSQVRHGQVANL